MDVRAYSTAHVLSHVLDPFSPLLSPRLKLLDNRALRRGQSGKQVREVYVQTQGDSRR